MQSDIFKFVIQSLKKELSTVSNIKFNIVDEILKDKKENQVQLSIRDIFQTSNDKIGQRIIVDEKRYEAPAAFEMRIRVNIFSGKQEDALSLFGAIAVFFKDNNVFECGEYNWHGNDINRFVLEPIIKKDSTNSFDDFLFLDYKVEVQLNSLKGEKFVRVEKKELSAKQVNKK